MIRVLVVEDNKELNSVICEYLRITFDWDVLAATTAAQARILARSGPLAFVLLDVVVGDAPAASIVRDIRELQDDPQLPIIIMSGFHPKDLAGSRHPSARMLQEEVKAIGAAAYLVKPFSLERLRETVEKVAAGISQCENEMAEWKTRN